MSDCEEIKHHLSGLATVAAPQAAVMAVMADQQRVLFTVNTALLRELRGQVDIELVRARTLEVFPDPVRDAAAVAMIHDMIGPIRTKEAQPSAEEERDHLREVARPRFRVIEGGVQGSEKIE